MDDTITSNTAPRAESPHQAVRSLTERLQAMDAERIAWSTAIGRVTAEPIIADRPSPPSDVSAMDGYAVRLADLARGGIEVAGAILPGRPAPLLPQGKTIRIMTGAAVPAGAEAVIRREDVRESPTQIEIAANVKAAPGQNIRRRGENLAAGGTVIEAGRLIDAPTLSALTSFGAAQVAVHRKVRVGVVVTGDELKRADQPVQPWEIRDSNGPALSAMLGVLPWVQWVGQVHATDEQNDLNKTIAEMLKHVDALILSGGVSMGTHDFVPGALAHCGCSMLFHKLPIRPGGPMLGAVGPRGQAVLGLPGNPLSVMTTMRRVGLAALRQLAGFSTPMTPTPAIQVVNPDGKSIKLWWYRPVKLLEGCKAELVDSRGSGDFVSAARSDGFIELPPETAAEAGKSWPFYSWSAM